MVREHKSLWRLEKEMSIKAFIRTPLCGLFDLEAGANKGSPTLEPYNDLFFDFTKFWEIVLEAYLGSKGPVAATSRHTTWRTRRSQSDPS